MNEEQRTKQVRLAADGDRDALQRLVVFYHDTLHRVAGNAIQPAMRAHIEPDDVLQEAYASAFRLIEDCDFQGSAGFYKWLERIVVNEVSTQQRAQGRQKRDVGRRARDPLAADSCLDLVHRLASPESTPSRHVAKSEATAAVMASLARLTDDQRAVIRMRILEDRPGREVAAALGKSEPAVHMLCHRALTQLRAYLVSITQYLSNL